MTVYIITALLIIVYVALAAVVIALLEEISSELPQKEGRKNTCEHEWEFICFDSPYMELGVGRCFYRCRKCGEIKSI